MQAGGRSLRLLSGVLGVGFCKLSKSRIASGQHGTQDKRKKNAGGGAGCRRRACPSGCSGAGFVLYMGGRKKFLVRWRGSSSVALLPFLSLLPLPFWSCRADWMPWRIPGGTGCRRAGGCCLLVADGRRGGVLVGKRGGRWPGVSPPASALCPCPSACWAWCWCWRAGCLASSAGQGWRGRRVGAGVCRCWAGCPGHQAGAIRHIAQSFA